MQNRYLLRQDVTITESRLRLALEDFMLSRQAMRCTAATLEHYRYSAGVFVSWLERQGLTQLEQVRATYVRNWLAEIAQAGAKDTTLHAKARGVKALLRFWAREGYLSQMVSFDMPRLAKKRLPALEVEQLRKAIGAAEEPRDKALLLFMADSGVRRAEAVSLNWGDVNFESGAVVVREGKGRKARITAIGAHSRRALLAYRRNPKQRLQAESPLWQAREGKRLTARGLRSALIRVGNRAGVHITPHMLRRSFALLSLRQGMDLVTLQRLVGHSDVRMTAHYLELMDTDLLVAHQRHGLDAWL